MLSYCRIIPNCKRNCLICLISLLIGSLLLSILYEQIYEKKLFTSDILDKLDINIVNNLTQNINFISINIGTIDINERFNISYDRERLCLAKTEGYVYPLQWDQFHDPVIIWEWNYTANSNLISPDYSIIITAFDSLNVLEKVILSTLKLTRGKWELIIVFDDVDDYCVNYVLNLVRNKWNPNNINENDCTLKDFISKDSQLYLDRYMNEYLKQTTLSYEYCVNIKKEMKWMNDCGNLQRIMFIRSEGVWETSSNNLGMCVSSDQSKFYVHLQDDMQMTQIGWNIHTVLPLIMFGDDIMSVSARCGTAIQGVFRKKIAEHVMEPFNMYDRKTALKHGVIAESKVIALGRCGRNIDVPLNDKTDYHLFKETTNSNRGPWAVSANDMKQLNYFNERAFKLIFDIGSLHLRGMTNLQKHTGYFPLQFRADMGWGGTRRHRRNKTKEEKLFRKQYEQWRNHRRDYVHAFLNISKNKYIANWDGYRNITMEMMDAIDDIWHFCA